MNKQLQIIVIILFCARGFGQDVKWEKSYGGKHAEYLFDAQPTADYGFILAGSSLSKKTGNKTVENMGDLDYWVWKMDETGELDWQKSFGGTGMDILKCIRLTVDGGFILGGTSNSDQGLEKSNACFGQEDFWIIKLDAKGNETWQRTIGGKGQDMLECIFQTADGGYIVGGSSSSTRSSADPTLANMLFGKKDAGFGNLDYWVIKITPKGDIDWQRTLGGSNMDILRSIVQAKDGGYIIGGSSNSPISGNKTETNYGKGDYWVVKLDKTGEMQWQKVYGGEDDDQLIILHQGRDDNFLLAGNSNSGGTGNKSKSSQSGTDFWVIKVDEIGDIIWQETYNIGKVDMLTSVVENDDHSLLLGGYAKSELIKNKKTDREDINDYVVIKTDDEGQELWRRTVGSAGEDVLRKAIETRDGGYLLAGTSKGKVSRDKKSGIGRSDFWVVKLNDKDKKKTVPVTIEAIPNPAMHFTNIIVGYEFYNGIATLYDLAGRQMQTFPIFERTIPIDLSNLPEGIYIVQIKTDVSTDAVKVIKGNSKSN